MEKYSKLMEVQKHDLNSDGTPRVPICLCLDVSGSMGEVIAGTYEETGKTVQRDGNTYSVVRGGISKLDELQRGIERFYESIRGDDLASVAAEICVVTFDDDAQCLAEFSRIKFQAKAPQLQCGGGTAMGEGVNLALDKLETRKQAYKDSGCDYYQPWLVLMSDGRPNGKPAELIRAMKRTSELAGNKKLTVIPVGIGDDADLETLSKFSPRHDAVILDQAKFRTMFEWLGKSIEKVSQSNPGEIVSVDYNSINQWGKRYLCDSERSEPWPDQL